MDRFYLYFRQEQIVSLYSRNVSGNFISIVCTCILDGTTTTTRVNYPKGESPPGVAARLGMGLGITIFALIVIVEIVYLRRKYGNNNPMRQSNYEFPSYHQHFILFVYQC